MKQSSTLPQDDELNFYRRLCVARFFEGVVVAILELSGYQVYGYGHEQLLPTLRQHFSRYGRSTAPTEERLRSSPDLLVVDPAASDRSKKLRLVEVKFRRWESPQDVRLSGVLWCQKYWPDALLVVVIPGGAYFYAQAVEQLAGEKNTFNLTQQFQRFEAVFEKTNPGTLRVFAEEVNRFVKAE